MHMCTLKRLHACYFSISLDMHSKLPQQPRGGQAVWQKSSVLDQQDMKEKQQQPCRDQLAREQDGSADMQLCHLKY
jgi:hypothetical protein